VAVIRNFEVMLGQTLNHSACVKFCNSVHCQTFVKYLVCHCNKVNKELNWTELN
jgi:hypothetical protein